jgi:hypothetical protein
VGDDRWGAPGRVPRDRRVVARRCGDIDEVELPCLGLQQRLGIGVDARAREHLTRLLSAGGAHIRHRCDLELVGGGEVGRDVAFLCDKSEPDEGTL